jgi:VanZ family protein
MGDRIRLFWFACSLAYTAAIFIFAGSPVVSDLSFFNPQSLLHIPLYGVLTVLFSLSMKGSLSLWIPGLIPFGVAIADEVHQGFVPGRDASAMDVLLDAVGIFIALLILRKLYIKHRA